MDKNTKIIALMAAFVMLAVPCMTLIGESDESDAVAGAAGNMNIYVNTGIGWTVYNVDNAYNAADALTHTNAYDGTTDSITAYTYSYVYDGATYQNISASYGDIIKLSDKTETGGNTWNTLVYLSNSTSWTVGSDAIGYYKPFADYMSEYQTANVAVWFGDATNSTIVSEAISSLGTFVSNNVTNALADVTPIDTNQGSVFEHVFYLTVDQGYTPTLNNNQAITVTTYDHINGTYASSVVRASTVASMLHNGIAIVGYGSDAKLALINAVGSGNASFASSTSPVPGFNTYGWLDSLFDLTTTTDASGGYHYWQLYTGYSGLGDTVNVSADFVLGAYSSLINAPLSDGKIALVYL